MLTEEYLRLQELLKEGMPEASDAVCKQALSDAEGAILDICNRKNITPRLHNLLSALAAVYARRIMAAGEISRSEGDVSMTTAYAKEIPSDLEKRILSHRKLKQAGIANETKI